MNVNKLQIQNLRNLESVDIELSPGLNFFLGPNGSGKTSLLEALYLLSRGRSFRTQNLKRLLRIGSTSMVLRTQVQGDQTHASETIDAAYPGNDGRLALRISGQRIERATDLSAILPVVLLHQDSHLLISSGPKYRRHFLDIGVFHVKPPYIGVWQYYKRVLNQRNAALRGRPSEVGLWDRALSQSASQLDIFRKEYIAVLAGDLSCIARELIGISGEVSMVYQRGWMEDEELSDTLRRCNDRDRTLGYTRDGPHRAELQIQIDERPGPVKDFLSRGQLKLLVYAMFFAQAKTLHRFTSNNALILADDIAAEVDTGGVERLLSVMRGICVQGVITNLMLPTSEERVRASLFHVKQGTVNLD